MTSSKDQLADARVKIPWQQTLRTSHHHHDLFPSQSPHLQRRLQPNRLLYLSASTGPFASNSGAKTSTNQDRL
ncbi:hypothetical protein BDN72DRAFT_962571 [Pluteus cervinus]|uniref:Uncharacterized protein n=1 Tax=Pluteus cervinus TaxID=181527 RepID=A0ACD3AI68_9AGAR|nr:hypothetical protein BDN72DRAFT_962571 [Pluteus cervinus]